MRRSPITLFAAGTALLLPLLFTTAITTAPWLVRYAALALVLGVGGPALVALAIHPTTVRRPALLALAFALWCVVSASLARFPVIAYFGVFGIGTGALFTLSLVAAWAIGSSIDDGGPRLVENAIVAAAGINIVVALLQMAMNLESLGLGLFDKRASGLLGNPVFLAELLAGAFWVVLMRATAQPARWALLAVGLGAGLQVSGSRLPLALVLATLVVALRRVPWNRVVLLGAALFVGLGLGAVVTANAGGTSTSTRLTETVGGAGNQARLQTWRVAGRAIVDHPVVGTGPGTYSQATGPGATLALAHSSPGRIFVDAHNLVIEYATTTGVPGAALLLAFLIAIIASGRRAVRSVPLLGFSLVVLAVHLVEPQNVAITPLAFLALGASFAGPGVGRRPLPQPVPVLAAVVGALATASLLVGGYYFQEATLDFRLATARTALRILPPWPQSATVVAKVYSFESKTIRHRPDLARQARRWQRIAADRYPANSNAWDDLAESQLGAGDLTGARTSLSQALYWEPWSTRALDDLATLELAEHHWLAARHAVERSLLVKPLQPGARALLAQADAGLRGG